MFLLLLLLLLLLVVPVLILTYSKLYTIIIIYLHMDSIIYCDWLNLCLDADLIGCRHILTSWLHCINVIVILPLITSYW